MPAARAAVDGAGHVVGVVGAARARRARAARIDCTPNDTRFTPAARYARSLARSTESGLHSTVTSASAARGIASRIRVSAAASSSDGVPPPKNTLLAGARRPPFEVAHAGVDVLVDQMGAVGPGREVAVVAA